MADRIRNGRGRLLWWPRADAAGRAGHGGRVPARTEVRTTGMFAEMSGPVWASAVPDVEKSKGERLDVNEGRRVGRGNGGVGL